MYKLFSERIKNKDGEPEVYIYDKFPEAFRNQVYYIMSDVLDKYEGYDDSLWDYMHEFDVGCRDIQPRYKSDLDTNVFVNNAIVELNYRFKQHNL